MHAMMKTLVSFPSMYKLVILCAILSLVVANVMEDEEVRDTLTAIPRVELEMDLSSPNAQMSFP